MSYSDPDRARNYRREYRLAVHSGNCCTTPVHPVIPIPFRLKTAQEVIDLLQKQVAVVRAENNAGTLEKGRTTGYLAATALKAIETGHLTARIEMLCASWVYSSNDEPESRLIDCSDRFGVIRLG